MHAAIRAVLLLCAAAICASAQARPLVIEETATLTNPNPADFVTFGAEVATNAEYALVLGSRDGYTGATYLHHRAALLFRRVNGRWAFQQVLRRTEREYDSYNFPHSFAMKGSLAAVGLDGETVAYRLGANGWQPEGGRIAGATVDTEIDGMRIVHSHGDCEWNASVADPNGSGGWTSTDLQGQPRGCDDEYWGGPVDVSGDRVIIGTPDTADLEPQEVPIYQRSSSGSWIRYGSIMGPQGLGLGGEVALRGNDAIIDGANGPYVYRLPDLYTPVARLQSTDAYLTNRTTVSRFATLEKNGDLVLLREPSWDRGVHVINVFRAAADGSYQHVAVLTPKNGGSVGASIDISGNVVIAGGNGTAYIFELPASLSTPAPGYDNFESGNTAGWNTLPGSQFAIFTSGANRLYRQTSTAGDARALLTGTDWTNQAIEADVTPTAFDGNDRWFGLITRYQDAQNYFYVTLRSSGTAQLRRVRAGVIGTIAQAPLAVAVNRQYRVRLESVGSVHRVYVDGQLLLDADDGGAPLHGRAGLAMYRTRADFDNVIVTPSPLTTVYADSFDNGRTGGWSLTGDGHWTLAAGAYAQNSVAGETRALIGPPVSDQIVSARVRPIAYAAGGTQDRWTGIVARHSDDRNYYYLTLRSGNTLSLRKLVNGAIFTLGSVSLSASPNTAYTLRLAAVGTQLRAYVNGALTLQANDATHVTGSVGLMTYKAAAQFDDFVAYQP